jgi:acetyl esterase/lipase
MKTIYLLSFSILTAMSLFAQNVEPTHKHVSYGSHKDMKLNFWKIEAKKPAPLLVHIHGGGWLGGKKNEAISPNILKQGYSYCSIDYRLAGTQLLPAAVHDAAPAEPPVTAMRDGSKFHSLALVRRN